MTSLFPLLFFLLIEISNRAQHQNIVIAPPCEIRSITKVIDGNSMSPLLKNGEKIRLLQDFYKCSHQELQVGDLVAYEYGGSKNLLIKKIIATPANRVFIKNNILFVDDQEVKNSIGESYEFSKGELNMLKIYISKDQKIPENSYFILGDNIYNSTDSRKFGAISAKNIWGKFEINK